MIVLSALLWYGPVSMPINTAATPQSTPEATETAEKKSQLGPTGRVISVDAFRGLVMLLLISGGFGFQGMSQQTDSSWIAWIAAQFKHADWEGLHLWDLVQPGFIFVVGLAMPVSFERRSREGNFQTLVRHVARRSLVLLLISQVIMSIKAGYPHLHLTNVLSQIALAYFFCFLIMQLRLRAQALIAVLILAGHWALFVLFPGSEGPYSKLDNIGALIDQATVAHFWNEWINPGHYLTINFIPSIVTMLFGVWTGRRLMDTSSQSYKLKMLVLATVSCVLAAMMLLPFNPMIKKLCTASFTLFSTRLVLLGLLFFYWIIEIKGFAQWTLPFRILGMNSIFIYCIHILLQGWISQALAVFTGRFEFMGLLAPVAHTSLVILALWYLCYWLYLRSIFIKV